MKATYLTAAGGLALTFTLAACIPQPDVPLPPPPESAATQAAAPEAMTEPAPPPPAAPAPTPSPPPPTPPLVKEPIFENYLDAPRTPGTWIYIEEPAISPGQSARSLAVYGPGKTAGPAGGEPIFFIVCDVANQRIGLSRKGDPSRPLAMTVTTETTERTLTATSPDGRAMVGAILPADDPLLDAMAITRGRFAVALEGQRTLYLPAWVEVSRVIEDCR